MTKKLIGAILEPMKDLILKQISQSVLTLKSYIGPVVNYFMRFLQVQLVISLVLLVILPSWGFAISMLSPLGNIIFTPVFVAFLLLSSLLFFAEILYIPNGFIIYFLEKITHAWLYLIPDFNNTFLIGFSKPPILFVIAVPLLTITTLTHRKINSLRKSVLFLFLLFALSCTYLKLINRPSRVIKNIACNGGNVTLVHENGKTVVIDPGFIGRRISATSWVEYTLIPEIIKSCGSNCIEHVVVMQPGKITFDALKKLITAMKVKNLHIICFFGQMKKSTAISFFMLKNEITKRSVMMYRIGFSRNSIDISESIKILIEPLKENIKYNETTYPALCVTCNIDNENLKIYSAKCKKSATNKKSGEKNEHTSSTTDRSKSRLSTN